VHLGVLGHIQGAISRVGQNRMYTPYMAVCMVISLPKIPYIHRVYMVLASPSYKRRGHKSQHCPLVLFSG